MDLGLQGKVGLVTGVSGGIGYATAQALIAEGMTVLGTSRTPPPATDGLSHLTMEMSAPEAGSAAVAAAVEQLGRLDLVVNNVGGTEFHAGFADSPDEEWEHYLQLNLMSAVRTIRAALPHLVETSGVVVNISSINGHLPESAISVYSATKAALNSLTTGLGREFGPRGVRVVGIAPGPVETPLWLGDAGVAAALSAASGDDRSAVVAAAAASIPYRRFSTAREIGDLVAFLASPLAGTITGTTVVVDGGITPTT